MKTIGKKYIEKMLTDITEKYVSKHLSITIRYIDKHISSNDGTINTVESGVFDRFYMCDDSIFGTFTLDEQIPYKKYCIHFNMSYIQTKDIKFLNIKTNPKMITYGSKEYPTRSINFPGRGEVLISTTELQKALEEDSYGDADEVADEIFEFVEEDDLNNTENSLVALIKYFKGID